MLPIYKSTRSHHNAMRPTESPSFSTRINGKGQDISRRYINPSKLEQLLDTRFGSEYKVRLERDKFTVFASGQLSEGEISSCA